MAVSHVSIDPDTVDALIDALTRLKRTTGSQDHKCTFMNMQACYVNEMDLSAIKTELAKANRMRDALQALADHAEDEVQEMMYKFPMVGIRGLPNELLSRIFEFACEQLDSGGRRAANGTCAIRLSQVCTHFRSIALNTPRLWASVSYDMMEYNGKLEAFLTRSKNAPLTIEIGGTPYLHDTFIKFLSAIKSHAHRWIKLNVSAYSGDFLSIRQAFGSEPLDFPILENIDVRWPEAQIVQDDNTFCLHWNMPALWRLSGMNWYPPPFPNSHLTSLEYVWYPGFEIREYVPEKLQMFINATHSLREFKLVIHDSRLEGTIIPPYLPAHFPQLIKLSLLFEFSYREQIADVMRTLHLPNLEELSIELYRVKARCLKVDRYIKALLPFHDKFPRLKDFRLSVLDGIGSRYLFDVSPVFSLLKLPALHNLSLELPKAHPHFGDRVRGNASVHAGPALRSLRLIKCDSVTDDFIEDALPIIRGGTSEDAFSLLEIRDCEKLSRSRVEAMLLPKEKLLWS